MMIKSLLFCSVLLGLVSNIFAFPFSEMVFVENNELDDADDVVIDLSHLGTSIYGEPDEEVGKKLENWNPEEGNPEELGSYGEGDILIPEPLGRNGLAGQSHKWRNNQIPYVISGSFSSQERNLIQRAFDEYHRKTCIRFVPRSNQQDYLSIENSNTGCWSSVGRTGGKQTVNLQSNGCTSTLGTPVHELMHAVGFLHEQNRSDRDAFVSIQWQNIPNSVRGNFEKASASTTTAFYVPYDYGSVMHYSARAFSNNGQNTITPLRSGGNQMGQRGGFSPSDIQKINRMYNCQSSGGYNPVSAPGPDAGPGSNPAPIPPPLPIGGGGGLKPGHVAGAIFSGLGNLLGALG